MHRLLRKSLRLAAALALIGAIAASVSIFAANPGDTTADRVLGQGDLMHSTSPSFVRAKSLNLGYRGEGSQFPGIAIDPKGHLYVVDQFSARVLGWPDAATFANGDPASIVIGQPDFFTTNGCGSGFTQALCSPLVASTDSAGNLYVGQAGNGSGPALVTEYKTPFSQTPPIAGTVVVSGVGVQGLAVDSHGNLYVSVAPYFSSGEILEYNAPLNHPTTSNLTFPGNCNTPSATTVCVPQGLAVDADDNLYVADTGFNRVLEFFRPLAAGGGTAGTPGSAGDTTADVVIGQSGFTTSNCADDFVGLCGPRGVNVDPHGNLYVADTNNGRVTEYDAPLSDGAAGNNFLGGGVGCGTITASTMCAPAGVATDPSGNLYVDDNNNNRVLAFTESNPPRNTTPSRVLGQHDFVHANANFVDASTVNPGYVAVDQNSTPNHLYVTDEPDNRVLGWKNATSFANGAPADLVIGQPDVFTNTCNTGGLSASSLCSGPGDNGTPSVAVDALGNLWVGDSGNRRALEFDAPFESGKTAGEAASIVVGQPNFTTGAAGVVCGGPICSSGMAVDSFGNLWAADFVNNRVYEFNDPLHYSGTVPEPPSLVLGQGSSGLNFSGGGCNTGGVSADSLCGPAGVAVDVLGNVYVADPGNGRVLVYFNPLAAGGGTPGTPGAAGDVTADVVFGQGGDFTKNACNNGGVTALSLCDPQGVSVDVFGSLFVADAFNHRVLGYAESNFTPSNVTAGIEFGQGTSGTDFTNNGQNSGGLSASSLLLGNPAGVASDAFDNLYVVDSGNVRVLGYNGPFSEPTATATPTVTPTPGPSTPTPTPISTGTPPPVETSTPTPTTIAPTATPTREPTPTATGPTPTLTPLACIASTPAPTVPMPTPTPPPGKPAITSMSNPVLVGGNLTINGRNFSAKPVINFFVSTAAGPVNAGPFTPSSISSSKLVVPIPATAPLGDGFVSVEVIDTDAGFTVSNAGYALLQGSATAGLPTILTVDDKGLAATSSDPSFATANVETVLAQGSAVTLGGRGFDITNGVAVDVFCACTGGKLLPTFIKPGDPNLTSTSITFTLAASAPTGPGSIVVSNAGASHSYAAKSAAVSVPIGARLNITSITQSGGIITVDGSGFSTLTVINLFNTQPGGVVNLGGFGPGGVARIPLTIVSSTRFTFSKPAGAVAGASFIQAFNPPFVPFTSSGNDPCAAFVLKPGL